MALALAPFVEAAVAEGPQLLAASKLAVDMAHRYGPKVRGAVNNIMHMGRRKKSALAYVKGLGTKKGLHKFFTKDIRKGLQFSKSAVTNVANVANDLSNMTDSGRQGGQLGAYGHKVAQAMRVGASHASRYHNMAEKYHSRAEQLVSPLKAYRY
jgi:hypothetical protein